ncbi:ABC-2 transporter permease [Clostridium neuense]|uniref:ABC-2 transporter permease n=1 Tax=Clostridium neuense TaxID=1728934 RepID=A0ABW8TFM2_9CLOT
MLNLISKDILMQKKTLAIAILFIFVESIYVYFAKEVPVIIISILVPFAVEYLLLTNSCLLDDKNKSYIIINSLPVTKKNVVIAKYISVLVFFVIAICIQSIFAALINSNKGIMKIEYIIICFCLIAILNSVYLPAYFKSGYAKTKWLIMILFFAMYLGISSINNHNLIKMIKIFTSMSYWTLCGSALLISAILMVISFFISSAFYNNRELSR